MKIIKNVTPGVIQIISKTDVLIDDDFEIAKMLVVNNTIETSQENLNQKYYDSDRRDTYEGSIMKTILLCRALLVNIQNAQQLGHIDSNHHLQFMQNQLNNGIKALRNGLFKSVD